MWGDLKQNIKHCFNADGTKGRWHILCCLVDSIHGETATKIYGAPASKRQRVHLDENITEPNDIPVSTPISTDQHITTES